MIICYVTFNWKAPFRFICAGPHRTTEEMWPCDWFYLAKYCYWKQPE